MLSNTEIINNLQAQIKLYQQMFEQLNSFSAPSSASSSAPSSAPSLAPSSAPFSVPSTAPLMLSSSALTSSSESSIPTNLRLIVKPNKAYVPVKDILTLFKLKKNEYNNILVSEK